MKCLMLLAAIVALATVSGCASDGDARNMPDKHTRPAITWNPTATPAVMPHMHNPYYPDWQKDH